MRVNARPTAAHLGVAAGEQQPQKQSVGGTAIMLRGVAAGSDGTKRARASEAGTSTAHSLTLYDSDDSYEHHVIDLRDDHYRGVIVRDGSGLTLRDSQSSEELSVDAGNRRDESDSDIAHTNRNGHLLNGKVEKHYEGAKVSDSAEEGANGGLQCPGKHRFAQGQLVWAKYARFPWWPALVMDHRGTLEGKGGTPSSDMDLLVRFFGTYDYGWVDPFLNLSDFEAKLVERSRIRKKALQKGIHEALTFQTSGILPDKWEPLYKYQNAHRNGHEIIPLEEFSQFSAGSRSGEVISRKRTPKLLFEESLSPRPQRALRRFRIMRQLGLIAPVGSPFTLEQDLYLSTSGMTFI